MSSRNPPSPQYQQVAKVVLRTCRELIEGLREQNPREATDDPRGQPSIQIVRGYFSTCYGVVRAFESDRFLLLVVGRLFTGPDDPGPTVSVQQIPIEGSRVLDVLTRANQELDDYLGMCTCGHELLDEEPATSDLDYVCPACRFRPYRPKLWRG